MVVNKLLIDVSNHLKNLLYSLLPTYHHILDFTLSCRRIFKKRRKKNSIPF